MKTLIVTGGTGGLGSAVVERLRREYRCILLYHRTPPSSGDSVQADLSDENSVRKAVAKAVEIRGAPYGLVHLAGGFAAGSVAGTSIETWRQMMELNLSGAFLIIREVLGVMNRGDGGRIIAISSEAAKKKPAGSAAYTISKAGLAVLIELVAKELKGTRITANALLPGTLDTDAMRSEMPDAARVPLDSVADAIAFLLSDAGSNVSGALIPLEAR
jgi:NAD(P)-dependent dehydrogenase (short-subunit alcohol dehydrogenase family)